MKFVFITDLHITASSNVRTGDVLEDIVAKFKFVAEYTNSIGAQLLCGGDLFDKPTCPEYVKTAIIPVLRSLKLPMICCRGNHETLYDNYDFNFKTAYAVMEMSGLFRDITDGEVEYEDCIVTNRYPITTVGKPRIMIYHGFLNHDDGRYTFHQDEINTRDQVLCLLGHDHGVYPDTKVYPHGDTSVDVTVIRPGSLLRQTRIDTQFRTPQMVVIDVKDGKAAYSYVDISCARPYNEIFDERLTTVSAAQQAATYDMIIESLTKAASQDMSLLDAVGMVAEPDVVEFVKYLQQEHQNKVNTKKV